MHILGDEGKRRQAERSPLIFKPQYLVFIDQAEIEFAGSNELCDQHRRVTILEILASQRLHEFFAVLFAHDPEHGGIPCILSFGKANLSLPRRIEKVLIAFGNSFFGNKPRVVGDDAQI